MPADAALLHQKHYLWDGPLRIIFALDPQRWDEEDASDIHPINIVADLKLTRKEYSKFSQHGAWAMDSFFTEMAMRAGQLTHRAEYIPVGNPPYSRAGDRLLTDAQKSVFDWGPGYPNEVTRGISSRRPQLSQ